MFQGLLKEQIAELEYEVINDHCRLNIVRLFREKTRHKDDNIGIILKNRIINIARQNEDLSIYRLESDDDGFYLPSEIAWHFGELESIPKRQSTCELIETLCDLIEENLISSEEVNEIFEIEH